MSENFILGLTLMAIGMGTVLIFLCVLIASMHVMSAIVQYLNKLFPEKVEVVERKVAKSSDDDSAIAVALAAIMARK